MRGIKLDEPAADVKCIGIGQLSFIKDSRIRRTAADIEINQTD